MDCRKLKSLLAHRLLLRSREAKPRTLNALPPEVKQRTAEVATVLEKSGVPRDVVLEVAGKAVAASGVDPDGYASQIASPEFRKAMKDLGWQPAPHNPAKWEPAALNKARTGAEMQQQKASMKPAEVVKKPEVPQALHEQMPDSKRVADLSKTRAPMIERLQKQGVVIRVVKDRKGSRRRAGDGGGEQSPCGDAKRQRRAACGADQS